MLKTLLPDWVGIVAGLRLWRQGMPCLYVIIIIVVITVPVVFVIAFQNQYSVNMIGHNNKWP